MMEIWYELKSVHLKKISLHIFDILTKIKRLINYSRLCL